MAKDLSLMWHIGVGGVAGALSSFGNVNKSLGRVKDATEELTKTQSKLVKIDKLRENFVSVNKEYVNAVKNLAKLKEEYDKSGKGNVEFAKKIKDTEKYVEKLNKQKERQKHMFTAARSELKKEGISLEGYKKKLEETNKAIARQAEYKKNMERYKGWDEKAESFSQKGGRQLKTGLALGAALLVPVKIYADIEESQADLRKILGKEAKKYYEDLAKISNDNPLSQIEMNEIAGSLAQSGIKGEDIVAYSEMAGKMKVAFDVSTDEAGNFLAKTKEQLNLSKEELFGYMDTINMLSNNYSVTAAQLADVSGRTAGFAKEIGLAKEANMAFSAALISSNVNAEQSSTVLGKLYAELAQGATTKAKASALDFLGLNSKTIHKEMAKDAEGTIVKVLEKIKNSSKADKAALITDIFGSDKSIINGISVLSGNLDGVKEKLKKAKDAVSENETVTGEYSDRIDTLTNQFKIFKNNIVNGMADIGKSVAPEIKESLDALKEWGASFGKFVKENPRLVVSIVKIVAGIAAFNLVLGGANKVASPFIKGLSWFGKFNAAKALGGWGLAFKKMFPLTSSVFGGLMKLVKGIKIVGLAMKGFLLANPIVLIIVAVVAAIAIFVVLYKKVEWFRNAAIQIFEGFKLYFGGIWKIIQGIFTGNFDLIKEGFFNMVEGIKKIFGGLIDIVKNTWGKIKGLFKDTNEKTDILKETGKKAAQATPPKMPQNWGGTNYFSGGLTSLAELGPELIQMSGNSFLATSKTVANLPKGSRILNNSSTKKTLSGRVNDMKNRMRDIVNNNNNQSSTSISGSPITIHINGAQNPTNVAQEVRKELERIQSKQRRTAII